MTLREVIHSFLKAALFFKTCLRAPKVNVCPVAQLLAEILSRSMIRVEHCFLEDQEGLSEALAFHAAAFVTTTHRHFDDNHLVPTSRQCQLLLRVAVREIGLQGRFERGGLSVGSC